jgi:hypothetical protein
MFMHGFGMHHRVILSARRAVIDSAMIPTPVVSGPQIAGDQGEQLRRSAYEGDTGAVTALLDGPQPPNVNYRCGYTGTTVRSVAASHGTPSGQVPHTRSVHHVSSGEEQSARGGPLTVASHSRIGRCPLSWPRFYPDDWP